MGGEKKAGYGMGKEGEGMDPEKGARVPRGPFFVLIPSTVLSSFPNWLQSCTRRAGGSCARVVREGFLGPRDVRLGLGLAPGTCFCWRSHFLGRGGRGQVGFERVWRGISNAFGGHFKRVWRDISNASGGA